MPLYRPLQRTDSPSPLVGEGKGRGGVDREHPGSKDPIRDTRYRLRRAQPRDLDALVRLEVYFPGDRLRRANLRHLLRHGHADVFVVECVDALVADAVVLYRRGSRHARLYSLVV